MSCIASEFYASVGYGKTEKKQVMNALIFLLALVLVACSADEACKSNAGCKDGCVCKNGICGSCKRCPMNHPGYGMMLIRDEVGCKDVEYRNEDNCPLMKCV
ncbi:unnamed protein product [Cylicocyclus nassatus]|uniref:Uncharacterized protein n=1 Tax=Cylicocyclus nassatus TaxID=53992 RepID=A0AA36GDK6_CYLNA|nr:unnamed protein product [Cylicocyclus nassatus]